MKRKADHHLEFLVGPPSKRDKHAAMDIEIENQQRALEAAAREAQREKERRAKGKGKLEDYEVAWWASAYADDSLGPQVPPIIPMVKPRKRAKILEPTSNLNTSTHSLSHKASQLASTSTTPLSASSSSLTTLIQGNISALRQLRKSHSRLAALSSSNDPSNEDRIIPTQPLESDTKEEPFAPIIDSHGTCGDISPRVALDGLRKVTGTMLAHVGFDSGNQSSVEALTHIATQYISNLGRTLRFYIDNHGQAMSSEVSPSTLFSSSLFCTDSLCVCFCSFVGNHPACSV